MGDADQGSKQVKRVEISAYVPASDRALHQRINRSLDLDAGSFIELRGASDNTIQCRAMICLAAMWSTNNSIHARNASIGGITSANLRSAAASFST
jgi:hypothetical protein